jgi:hypothetical protein
MNAIFNEIYNDPSLLKSSYPAMKLFLHSKGDTTSQGSGNPPTDQEAAFATLVESHGYEYLDNTKDPPEEGYYYKYQLGGSQRSKDFMLIEKDADTTKQVMIDLKHTKSKSFYLNDGWFDKDTVYIVSWTHKKNIKVFIGLGQDIPTSEETERMAKLNEVKKSFNTDNSKTGSLRIYMRYANQYSCEKFTEEFSENKFKSVLEFLT